MHIDFTKEAEAWTKRKHDVFDAINRSGLPLVLFGRSTGTNPAFLREVTAPVQFVCSSNPHSWGKRLWGLEVVGPDQVQEAYRAYNILILAVDYQNEFVSQFQQLSIPPTEIFQLDLHYEKEDTASFFQRMHPTIEWIYDRLADQQSKDAYEVMLRYRVNRSPGYLSQIIRPAAEQYFPRQLGGKNFLGADEVFADVGAYTGDTVEGFISAVSGQYHSIFAFEPNPENFELLQKNTARFQNVFCRPIGISEKPEQIHFSLDGSRSKAVNSGEQVIQTDTLDHLFADKQVTLIKMDIEGMECPALRGAKRTIEKYRPKLAICTYHSNEDMVYVPETIIKFNPDYQLYFGHYTPSVVDSVCYAV